jgi:mono/diheme cytochrome c family protein
MRILTISLAAAICSAPGYAANGDNVQKLYEQHCVSCHGTELYTREDRKVTSLPALKQQVRRCETALGLRWFDEEIADVAQFLNEHYYRFQP